MTITPHGDGDENEQRDPEEGVRPLAVIVEVLHRQLVVVQRPNFTAHLSITLMIMMMILVMIMTIGCSCLRSHR